ncbi:MerR family transcriptional regulator [Mangrovihabitans endophyticus]|uniref:MerR family transcriptional regulator n=1 Tax=Mangrovihabitans endophyticus TaxID=1751298 RepID=A0A8J3C4K7_9ACTN|nr:MerR family transcriptional regulator [Mangrovihabitans endophyticus]
MAGVARTLPAGAAGHYGVRMMQIGEAAGRAGLSIRTLRHYEEAGLITPSARSDGGFRLYTEADLGRLRLVRRMKPIGFTLDQMREVLHLLDALESGAATSAVRDRLAEFHAAALQRVRTLRDELATAEEFVSRLEHQMSARMTRPRSPAGAATGRPRRS